MKINLTLASLAFAGSLFAAPALKADDMKVPTTAADHDALAKKYHDEAEHYRATAAEHKAMAEAFAKWHPDAKGGAKNPANEKMKKHCETLAKDAEKLATDADKAADYHTLRAKELQGK